MHPAHQQEFDKLHQHRHDLMKQITEQDKVIIDQAELIHELEDKLQFIKRIANGDIVTGTI